MSETQTDIISAPLAKMWFFLLIPRTEEERKHVTSHLSTSRFKREEKGESETSQIGLMFHILHVVLLSSDFASKQACLNQLRRSLRSCEPPSEAHDHTFMSAFSAAAQRACPLTRRRLPSVLAAFREARRRRSSSSSSTRRWVKTSRVVKIKVVCGVN